MCRPSQTPHLAKSSAQIIHQKGQFWIQNPPWRKFQSNGKNKVTLRIVVLAHPPKGIQVVCARLKHQGNDPYAQPSELILFPCLVESHHIDTQRTRQTSQCVSTLWGHRRALCWLTSRIRLARSSSELAVHCTEKPGRTPCSPIRATHESAMYQQART